MEERIKEVIKNCYIPDVNRRLYLDDISIELYSNDSDEDYRIDISISNTHGEAYLNKEKANKLYKYLGASLNCTQHGNKQDLKPNYERKIKEVIDLFKLNKKSGSQLTREREIVYKRQYFIHYLREATDLSTTHIGRLLGLDHSTIIYATKQVNDYISINDKYFNVVVKEIKDYLELNPIQTEKTIKKHNIYDIINRVIKCETLEDLNDLKKYIRE